VSVRPNQFRCDAPNIYRGFGRSDLAIKAAVRTGRSNLSVRVAEAFQPARSPAACSRDRASDSPRNSSVPHSPAIQKGLARASQRVQLGCTRGGGVAVLNSYKISIVTWFQERPVGGASPIKTDGVEVYGTRKFVSTSSSAAVGCECLNGLTMLPWDAHLMLPQLGVELTRRRRLFVPPVAVQGC
jgi:hypothetical protein